jgi:hypothetical protein
MFRCWVGQKSEGSCQQSETSVALKQAQHETARPCEATRDGALTRLAAGPGHRWSQLGVVSLLQAPATGL